MTFASSYSWDTALRWPAPASAFHSASLPLDKLGDHARSASVTVPKITTRSNINSGKEQVSSQQLTQAVCMVRPSAENRRELKRASRWNERAVARRYLLFAEIWSNHV